MISKKIKKGLAYYKRPSWGEWIPVTVEQDDDRDMVVRFSEKNYPVKISNLPADAMIKQ